jgi:hypothetical protein
MTLPHPKPGKRKPEAVHVYPDGREVCNRRTVAGRAEYMGRTLDMSRRQGRRCALCPFLMVPGDETFEHEEGRGMGGSHQDDRIVVNGEWKNAAVHYGCNGRKGSKRYHWLDGKYVPKERA